MSGATVDRVKRDQFGIPRVLRPVPGAWWERAYAVPEAVPADRSPMVDVQVWLPVRIGRGPTVAEVLATQRGVDPDLVVGIEVLVVLAQCPVEPTEQNGYVENWVLCHAVLYRLTLELLRHPERELTGADEWSGESLRSLSIEGIYERGLWRVSIRECRAPDQTATWREIGKRSFDDRLRHLFAIGRADSSAEVVGEVSIEDRPGSDESDVLAASVSWILGRLPAEVNVRAILSLDGLVPFRRRGRLEKRYFDAVLFVDRVA